MVDKTEVKFSEVPVADVAAFFVQGYRLEEGERIVRHEHYYDPHKGVCVFKLMVERAAPEGGAE